MALLASASACNITDTGSFLGFGGASGAGDPSSGLGFADYESCQASVAEPHPEPYRKSSNSATEADHYPAALEAMGPDVDATARKDERLTMRGEVAWTRHSSLQYARCRSYPHTVPQPGPFWEGSSTSSSGNVVAEPYLSEDAVQGADFVDHDAQDVVVATGSTARIVRVQPAAATHELARVSVTGTARKVFLAGDRLAVFSSLEPLVRRSALCEHGFDRCIYSEDHPIEDDQGTLVTVFDVSDRAHPAPLRTIRSDSALVTAYRRGDIVHMVLSIPGGFRPSFYKTYPEGLREDSTEDEVNGLFDQLLVHNEALIDRMTVRRDLPLITEGDGTVHEPVAFRSLFNDDGSTFTTFASFALHDATKLKAIAIESPGGPTVASNDALYMVVPHYRGGFGWIEGQDSLTQLSTVYALKIGASPLDTDYLTTGIAPGRVTGPSSLDAPAGSLRILTTTGKIPSPDEDHRLVVMQQHGASLDVVGKLEHIAPNADLRRVRFEGNRAYVLAKSAPAVSVLDLTSPTAPALVSAFGPSARTFATSWAHTVDATHVVTFGTDAGDCGFGLKLYDVSDPAHATLTFEEKIGAGFCQQADARRLPFSYIDGKNLIALRARLGSGGTTTFEGLMLYDASTTTGFSLRSKIANPGVKRGVFLDDSVYGISNLGVKVNPLAAPSADIAEYTF